MYFVYCLVSLMTIALNLHNTEALLNQNHINQLSLQPPPPPPQTNGLFKLSQMSPASALLANEFFANERQRGVANPEESRPAVATTTTTTNQIQDSQLFGQNIISPAVYSKAVASMQFRLDKYHSLEEIDAFLEALQNQYPRKVSLFSIGQTFEGRPIRALEIINNKTDSDLVWLDALTHAREWVTGSTILYIIDQILAPINTHAQQQSIVQMKNYIIIPVVNPDGYSYTWTTNRMWRKNRSKSTVPKSNCLGVSSVTHREEKCAQLYLYIHILIRSIRI